MSYLNNFWYWAAELQQATWIWINSLSRHEWLVLLSIGMVLGIMCLRGMGSRKYY